MSKIFSHTTPTTAQFFSQYQGLDWKYHRLVFAITAAKMYYLLQQKKDLASLPELWQLSSKPDWKGWDKTLRTADYCCPSTFFQYKKKWETRAIQESLNSIPWVCADLDYIGKKPTPGRVYLDCLDLDLPPSMVVSTPHGYHLWWKLQEPLVMRWEQNVGTGAWVPRPEAKKALSWYRDISYGLTRMLIAEGLPADSAAAGQPARLFRKPTRANIVWWNPTTQYDMVTLSDRTAGYKGKVRKVSIGGIQLTTLLSALEELPGEVEGGRNAMCWKVALASSIASKGNSAGWRTVRNWATRCIPAYPEKEAWQIWKWAQRRYVQGKVYAMPRRLNKYTRSESARRAHTFKRLSTDEKIAKAVLELQAQGISEPWSIPSKLADISGVSKRTIFNRKKALFS